VVQVNHGTVQADRTMLIPWRGVLTVCHLACHVGDGPAPRVRSQADNQTTRSSATSPAGLSWHSHDIRRWYWRPVPAAT